MKTPPDGWTPEEREALSDFEMDLEALQDRHSADPPLDVLRAGRAGVLPEPLQARVARRLQENPWDRALIDGIEVAGELDEHARARMLQRLQQLRSTESGTRAVRHRLWVTALATAAVALLAVAGWKYLVDGVDENQSPAAAQKVTADRRLASSSFVLPLDPPEVRLSAAALVFRRGGSAGTLVEDLKPAIDAYQARDYAAADRAFTRLSPQHPGSIEIAFYGGVTRLLLGDIAGAAERLDAAQRIAEAAFADDVAWYRAIVDERGGDRPRARQRLLALCHGGGGQSARACTAMEGLK